MSDSPEAPAAENEANPAPTRDTHSAAAEGAAGTPFAPYAASYAVVVGIDDYGPEHPVLANARRDAEAVARMLADDYGFDEVLTLYDAEATHDAILSLLRDQLPAQTGPEDRVVIFFAGHGATRTSPSGERRGYLVPHDAHRDRYAEYVDMNEVRDVCGWLQAKHVLIILDCCFSGVAAIAARAQPALPPDVLSDAYLRRITDRRAWQVFTAGASDDLAADSGVVPGHSAFTGALLAGLRGQADGNGDGLITASELAGYVAPRVSRETARHGAAGQTPFFNYVAGSEEGDCVFLVPGATFVPPETETLAGKMPGVSAETLWRQLLRARWFWPAVAALLVLVAVLGIVMAWQRALTAKRLEELVATITAVAVQRETDTHSLIETLSAEAIATQRAEVIEGQATLRAVEKKATSVSLSDSDETRVVALNDLFRQEAELTRVVVDAVATAAAIPRMAAATLDARGVATVDLVAIRTLGIALTPTLTRTPRPTPSPTALAPAGGAPFLRGQTLLFVSTRSGSSRIYQMGDLQGRLTKPALVPSKGELSHGRPRVSCAAGSVLMHASGSAGRQYDLYRLELGVGTSGDLALRDPERLTGRWGWDQLDGSWSPQGDRIVYFSSVDDLKRLWIMDAATGSAHSLTKGKPFADEQPAWSPDGQWIACVSQAEGDSGWELYLLGLDGERIQLTKLGGVVRAPTWSPNGRWIACAVGQSETEDIAIVSVEARGASLKNLLRYETAQREDRPAWSPDGGWVACDRVYDDGGQLEIVVYEVSTTSVADVYPAPQRATPLVRVTSAVASLSSSRDEKLMWGREYRLTKETAEDWGPAWVPYEARCLPRGLQ